MTHSYHYDKSALTSLLQAHPEWVDACISHLAKQQTEEELRNRKTIVKNHRGFSQDWAEAGSQLYEWITGRSPYDPNCKSGYKQGRIRIGYPMTQLHTPKTLATGMPDAPKRLWKKHVIKNNAKDMVDLGRIIAIAHYKQLEGTYHYAMTCINNRKASRIKEQEDLIRVLSGKVKRYASENRDLKTKLDQLSNAQNTYHDKLKSYEAKRTYDNMVKQDALVKYRIITVILLIAGVVSHVIL